MATNEERLVQPVDDNLMVEGRSPGDPLNMDRNIADAGVASAGIVAFLKLVNKVLGVSITAGDCGDLLTPRNLVEYLDANAA